MGGFKNQIQDDGAGYGGGPYSDGGKGEWPDVSPRRRCPICNRGSWCQVKRDGSVALCKRIGSGRRAKENERGETFYVHVLHGSSRAEPLPPLPPSVERPPPDALDRAYQALFDALPLDPDDRRGLRARGLDDAAIDANGYATLPLRGRAALARSVIDAVGEDVARAVPGVVLKTSDDGRGRSWWSVGGAPGVLVPVRDLAGRIVAVKVRRREADADQQRYLYLSSARAGGASAASVVHIPVPARALVGGRLVITEGELKADVATHLLPGWAVVSLPGHGTWRMGAAFAESVGARTVAVALDADAAKNKEVLRSRDALHLALRGRLGEGAELWKWDPRFNGLDDYLAAARGEVAA